VSEPAPKTSMNGPAIGSLVAGVLSLPVLLFVSIVIGLILALVGMGLSGVGRNWADTRGVGGKGLAIAGLVTSLATVVASVIANVLD
jgi:hypothetical protein